MQLIFKRPFLALTGCSALLIGLVAGVWLLSPDTDEAIADVRIAAAG